MTTYRFSMQEFAAEARKTAQYPGKGTLSGVLYCGLGLTGEAGEVADKLKKILRDDAGVFDPVKRLAILKELGDVLWYVSSLADELGSSLDEVAGLNIEKLASRKERDVLRGSGDDR